MIQPGVLDLKMWQGATWNYELIWEDGNPSAPVDLTGYTAKMQVRATKADTKVILELTSLLGGGITLGGALGTIDLDLNAGYTRWVPAGRFVYDLEMTNGATVTRLIEGAFVVSGEVTR
jgi:hypothetical protein